MEMLNHKMILGEVGLKVSNLEQSIKFYTDTIGMNLISESEHQAILGIDQQPLVHLVEDTSFVRANVAHTGLFHLAILLPDEKDLGQLLYHFSRVNYQLDGAGDHLYSQAFYMHDPDGHGIEIYADRPRSTWTYLEDGTVQSGTFEVDVQRLVNLVEVESWQGLPKGTQMGHVHLQVKDVDQFRKFYVDVMKMEVMTVWSGALFVSKNGYHHHVAGNRWANPQSWLPEKTLGMLYYTMKVDNLEEIKSQLDSTFATRDEVDGFYINDGNGIWLRLISQ